jgi:hypothetical protein
MKLDDFDLQGLIGSDQAFKENFTERLDDTLSKIKQITTSLEDNHENLLRLLGEEIELDYRKVDNANMLIRDTLTQQKELQLQIDTAVNDCNTYLGSGKCTKNSELTQIVDDLNFLQNIQFFSEEVLIRNHEFINDYEVLKSDTNTLTQHAEPTLQDMMQSEDIYFL